MKVSIQKLKEALSIVRPGLAIKGLMEQTRSFSFLKGFVITYNDEISIRYPLEDIDFEGVIEASQFYSFVDKLQKEEMEYQVKENEIVFKVGRAKAGFVFQQVQLPLDIIPEDMKWSKLPEDFLKYLARAKDVCSVDLSRPMLTCVHVLPEGVLQASDSLRLLQINLGEKIGSNEFLLPSNSARSVVSFVPTHIGHSDGWVHFKRDDGVLLSCRVFDDKYVDFSKYLDVQGNELTFPKSLKSVIEKAAVFSKRDFLLEEVVSVEVAPRRLTIRSNSDSGWFEETLNMRYKGPEFSFQIAPIALSDILEDTTKAVISDSLLSFKTDNWIYVSAYTKKEE